MMKKTGSIRKTYITQYFMLLILLCTSQIAFGDDVQKSIDTNYFRTPEASAFKKYGEESVNEYTGTADISVPLYTIKSKDIEIPLVLRYDASGIKVEQEASWVGLGWNLMVGGCINYVSAGGHDMVNSWNSDDQVWTEYLSSEFENSDNTILTGSEAASKSHRSQIRYYKYDSNAQYNWMGKMPLKPQEFVMSYVDNFSGSVNAGMKDYIDNGYGERDFYSVNVMGKSFMFFIDPATLKVFHIGKAGEEFKVSPIYEGSYKKGLGKQSDVEKWQITDSNGFMYQFDVRDRYLVDTKTNVSYTSCWYLTKIVSPLGETAEFTYTQLNRKAKRTKVESVRVASPHLGCCSSAGGITHTNYIQNENNNMEVSVHYLCKIKTSNQTVTFDLSDCNENSGKSLTSIKAFSNDGSTIKNIKFSYSSFKHTNVGGNYDENTIEYDRLKLDNVKEIASSEALTTSFEYNSSNLPSRRSSAQDYWGYYNGQNNYVKDYGYTLIPTPQEFMSSSYTNSLGEYKGIGGADRLSRGEFMQAAMLTKVVYPTGGYTEYNYEANSILTSYFAESDKFLSKSYDVSVSAKFTVSTSPYGLDVNQEEQEKCFSLSESCDCDLLISCGGTDELNGQSFQVNLFQVKNGTRSIVGNYTLQFQNTNKFTNIESLKLAGGDYVLQVIPIGRNNGMPFGITAALKGWHKGTDTKYTLTCGGLRIKEIRNFDNDNKLINHTTYDYSGGVLLNKIETIDYSKCYNLGPNLVGNHPVEVYTISPGHPRMQAFYASCNPGIVGYSCVSRKKYNANGNLEKNIITKYRNNAPTNWYGKDYYAHFDNGQVEKQEIRDASDAIIATTRNTYDCDTLIHYSTNIVANYKTIGQGPSAVVCSFNLDIYDAPNVTPTETKAVYTSSASGMVDVLRYPYIISRDELVQTTTTEYSSDGRSVVSTKKYSYNPKNHQVSQIDESMSNTNQVRRTKIKYAVDVDAIDTINFVSRQMPSMVHRLNDVVETQNTLIERGEEKRLSTTNTIYGNKQIDKTWYFYPVSSATSIGDNSLENRAKYSYNDSLNVRSVSVDGMETVYIWSYNGHYPVAKIEGLTYDEVEEELGKNTISTLLKSAVPNETTVNSMRDKITNKGGLVTTYTYKPLVGITSQTLPNGLKTTYEYDGFGRLAKVINHDDHTLSTNSYNYKKP